MRRAPHTAWWLVVAVTTVVVVANVARSHTTDDPLLANEAATALQKAGLASGIQAVGATTDGRVFITLMDAASSPSSSPGGPSQLQTLARDVFSGARDAKVVVVLNASHSVTGSYDRRS